MHALVNDVIAALMFLHKRLMALQPEPDAD